jgi:tetratricopeptide (TPR) repeat protein
VQNKISKTGIAASIKENKTLCLLLAGLFIIVLVEATYWKSSDNSFVNWDDYAYIVDNELVRNPGDSYLKDLFTTPVCQNYHPLTILSLRLDNNICKTCPEGISPKPFIRGNIILHVLNSLLVLFFVFLLTDRNIIASFLVALLFGIHPMHVESVVWISERKDVLYTFFFLAGLISYMYFKKEGQRKYLWLTVTFILFIMSCLSKATAVVFPVILILIDFWIGYTEKKPVGNILKNIIFSRNILLLIPFFIVSVFIGLLAFKIQDNQNFLGMLNLSKNMPDVVNTVHPFSLIQRFQIASYGFIVYILKFFIPVNLYAFYPYPELKEFISGSFKIILWLSTASTIIIFLAVIYSMKKSKLYAFGIGFYLITVILVLQFISVGFAIMADRYSYLPYAGLSLIPAMLISNSKKTIKNILLIISGCFIILLMFLSGQQVKIWKNPETLWTNVLKKYSHLELARRARGKYYSKMSSLARSENEKKMLEDKAFTDFTEAIKAGTKNSDVFEGTAIIYESRGEPEKALMFINKTISMNPKKGGAYYNRAMIYDMLDQKENAIKDYNMALIYSTDLTIEILSNRSVLFLETGQFKEAVNDLDYLISANPKEFMYYSNRAFAKIQLKDIDGAIADYRTVLQLKPDDQVTKKQLQILLDSQNR